MYRGIISCYFVVSLLFVILLSNIQGAAFATSSSKWSEAQLQNAPLSAPLAPLSSFRRVQNLDPLNTASITATIYKQDGSVQTVFNATVNPYRSALIDNGSLPSDGFSIWKWLQGK